MAGQPDQSEVNTAFLGFLARLDMRLLALEATVADTLYKKNKEQKEAFHADVRRRFELFYDERMKQSAVTEPKLVAKIRAQKRKSKGQ